MAVNNYNPNAPYDNGPSAAGSDRVSYPQPATGRTGMRIDSTVSNSNVRSGFNCAGNLRTNTGPNAAGKLKSTPPVS